MDRSQAYKYYVAGLVCFGMFFCNFLAAGPTVAIVGIASDFPSATFSEAISKVSYFFTASALLQGVGNLFWMPLILKFGRRPIYTASFSLYTLTALWSGISTTYTSELMGRMVMGFAAGSGESLGALTIADIFFLHERGTMMA
jgi:MFS family permease